MESAESSMAEDLYTSAFAELDSPDVSGEVQRAIAFLETHQDVLSVYRVACGTSRHDREKVLVGAELHVEPYLPSRLDPVQEGMLPVEPVVFLFDAQRYPRSAPGVGSDRKDFAWKGKPHVSQPTNGWPPLFCLSRAPLDDWFAERGFAAFFDRLFSWLIDAAQGELQRKDGRFEPTMAPSLMSCVFDYSRTVSWIEGQRKIAHKSDFSYAQFQAMRQDENAHGSGEPARHMIRFDGPTSLQTANRYIREPHTDEEGLAHGGLVAWMKEDEYTAQHFSLLPESRSDLVKWGRDLDIEINEPLGALVSAAQSAGVSQFFIPMLIGVQRPSKLFGVENDLEILPLLYHHSDEVEQVFFMRHQHLHTAKRARQLSNTEKLGTPVTLVGGGALGSKFFEHWYRGGQTGWTLIDGDVLAPHNLTRHALGPNAEGGLKVEGLREAVAGMFEEGIENDGAIETAGTSFADALEDEALRRRIEGSFVVDATASAVALQELTSSEMPPLAGAARGFIIDEGRKAALLLEGADRSPRLDDARAYLYQLGITEDSVSDWLSRREQQQDASAGLRGEEVEIGLGCASDTFRLSDDEVSFHAAQLSMRLRSWLGAHNGLAASTGEATDESGKDGKVGLSSASGGWEEWKVPPVVVEEADGWQVRLMQEAVDVMAHLRQEHAPKETGGIALGRINYNRRFIFVTQVLPPPSDSTCAPAKFVRGTEGVRSALKRASDRTGSMIGYVAEWHSHPLGPRQLSDKDFKMAHRTRRRYGGSTFPAVVIVAAPSGLAVHVEEDA